MTIRTRYAMSAMAVVFALGGAHAIGSTVYNLNLNSPSNTSALITKTKWAMNEVSLAGTDRFSPTISLQLFDAAIGSRDVTMRLFAGDGAITAPAAGTTIAGSEIASLTVSTPNLGGNNNDATTVSWTFDGVTLPDNLIIALEIADTDVQLSSLIRITLQNGTPTADTGTNLGMNFSDNDGASWSFSTPNNSTTFGFGNFTIDAQAITAVPLPSAAFLGAAGLLGLATRRRRAAVNN